MAEWRQLWAIDPWGAQRLDVHFARLMWAVLQPNVKTTLDWRDYQLFSDDRLDLPDDVSDAERRMMEVLSRAAGG